jgi:hypothetical protein
MASDQIPRSTVIRRLLALTSEGKIKWEHDGEKPASSFGRCCSASNRPG